MTTRYRIFEAFDDHAGDKVRWIAATTEADAETARTRRGWRRGAEISATCIPSDRPGLLQMGVDVIVKPKRPADGC